jgi:hypothetical protein
MLVTGRNYQRQTRVCASTGDIEVAQYVYLLSNNQKIRNVIDTITSKAVLILALIFVVQT